MNAFVQKTLAPARDKDAYCFKILTSLNVAFYGNVIIPNYIDTDCRAYYSISIKVILNVIIDLIHFHKS